jgi:hypothetical protein
MKIRPVGAELFHADGWTDSQDMIKLIVAFLSFANIPTKNKMTPMWVFKYNYRRWFNVIRGYILVLCITTVTSYSLHYARLHYTTLHSCTKLTF